VFGIPEEASDKLSLILAAAMGATAALGMVAAVVTSTTRLDNCYGISSGSSSSSSTTTHKQQQQQPPNTTTPSTKCEGIRESNPSQENRSSRLLRKKKTLVVANDAATAATLSSTDEEGGSDSGTNDQPKKQRTGFLQRLSTREEINKLRKNEKEMLQRWERDEDGWRELPARAWPAYQPGPEQLKGIMAEIKLLGCLNDDSRPSTTSKKSKNTRTKNQVQNIAQRVEEEDEKGLCTQLQFDMATALVFYNINPQKGLETYRRLATNQGHVDSMVACGIVLVEGLGVPPREREGISWLERAIDEDDNSQALYELATVYYTGLDDVVEEDPTKAFELFERAAAQNHTGAMYMMADCLVEGEGCERSVARAVPLFYKAAERGHRYSRQRIRELLARIDYPF
jgi:TPR repeat protein